VNFYLYLLLRILFFSLRRKVLSLNRFFNLPSSLCVPLGQNIYVSISGCLNFDFFVFAMKSIFTGFYFFIGMNNLKTQIKNLFRGYSTKPCFVWGDYKGFSIFWPVNRVWGDFHHLSLNYHFLVAPLRVWTWCSLLCLVDSVLKLFQHISFLFSCMGIQLKEISGKYFYCPFGFCWGTV
jgi:hypothetical protein